MATFKRDDGVGMIHEAAASTDVVLGAKVIGDAYNRFQVTAAGTISVGNGTAAPTSHAAEVLNVRVRCTAAEIKAGKSLVAAIPGYKIRMVAASAIAYGGAVGATTSVDILGTRTSAVHLVAFAQASLTQSTLLNAGDSGAAILADGASFTALDANTAVTVGLVGSDITTATGVDIIFSYVLEA